MPSGSTLIPRLAGGFSGDNLLPLIQHVDHVSFPHILGEVLRRDPDLAKIRYTFAYPTTPAEVPCIVSTLVSRTPGLGGVETQKARLRQTLATQDGTRVQLWAQWMTCLYQFDCCAATAQEADTLSLQLDDLLHNSVWIFQHLGAKDLIFQEQLTDQLLPRIERVMARSLRWTAQLDRLEIRTEPTIRDVRVQVLRPTAEFVEPVVRGATLEDGDLLTQPYVSQVLFVSDPQPDGVGRASDYLKEVDFLVLADKITKQARLFWLEAGKRPDPGSTYYVRYLYWNNFATLFLP